MHDRPDFQGVPQETGSGDEAVDGDLALAGFGQAPHRHDDGGHVSSVVDFSHQWRLALLEVPAGAERLTPTPVSEAFDAQPKLQGGLVSPPGVHVGL